MSIFLNPRWRLFLGVLALVWLFIIAGIELVGFQETYPLPISEIRHDAGCGYVIDLKNRPFGWPITTFVGDTQLAPSASSLLLFENGNPIGLPHTLHDQIRKKGLGHYSHWYHTKYELYFSTPDCSDPRFNDRSYEVKLPIELSIWTHASWLIALAIFGLIVNRPFTKRAVGLLCTPLDISQRPILGVGVFVLLVLCAWGFLAGEWTAGKSNGFAAASFYQISDAKGYWFCSNALADTRTFGGPLESEWCQRRAIYPTFLSGISLLGGRNIFGTLLVQALIVSVAIFLFLRKISPYVGAVGAAVCAAVLFRFATDHAFPATMTENAGIIFGCVGFGLLLKASEDRLLLWMVAGMVIVSVALNARAGAFFVFPCLILWAGFMAHVFHRRVWQWVIASSLAILVGFALQVALVLAVGGNPGQSHGNFAYTLYGLSVGGKGWSQVLKDHPDISKLSDSAASQAIYALAWDNVISQPTLFLEGLSKNISVFLSSGIYDYSILGRWAVFIQILWWLAWIPMLLNCKKPIYSLTALSSLGVVLSVSFLRMDGEERIFAATVPVEALQLGVGVFFTGRVLRHGIQAFFLSNEEQQAHKGGHITLMQSYMEPVVLLLLLPILVIPFTPLRLLQAQQPVEVEKCHNGEYTAAARLGSGGTLLLDLVSDSQKADFLKGEIRRKDLADGIPRSSRWRDELLAFGGTSLLLAYQLVANHPASPGPDPIFSDEHLAKYHGHLVRLCLDNTKHNVIFGIPFRKLNSISILD